MTKHFCVSMVKQEEACIPAVLLAEVEVLLGGEELPVAELLPEARERD